MTENMKGLLLEDRWAPVISEMGFLETDAEHAARAYAAWQGGLLASRGIAVAVRPVSGPLEQALSALLPLTSPEALRHLKDKGRYGAVMLEVYGPRQTDWLNYLRTLYAANDGGRWVFGRSGEPFAFEKQEQYQARRVRDHFTLDLLKEYLHHLGLSPFEEDFYLPRGTAAWLVEKTGPVVPTHKEYTLAQAREQF